MKQRKLTAKQEAFALAFIETGNASEAYRRSYNAQNMKEQTVRKRASELLRNGYVAGRVEVLRSKSAERHDMTVSKLSQMAIDAYNLAMEEDVAAPAAAISAVLALGKLHGLIVERKHVTGDHQHHHSAEPVSASAEWLAELLGTGPDRKAQKPLPN